MIDHNGAWLPSVTWGVPVLAALTLICIASIVALFLFAEWDTVGVFGTMLGLGLLGIVIGSVFGYWPFKADYHRLQPATGVVREVDSRFLAASQYVVVTYDTGLVVRCDDSRCATVKPGQTLRLLCTKEHQFGSPLAADGWSCRWGQL